MITYPGSCVRASSGRGGESVAMVYGNVSNFLRRLGLQSAAMLYGGFRERGWALTVHVT